jgi:hypothetical protein
MIRHIKSVPALLIFLVFCMTHTFAQDSLVGGDIRVEGAILSTHVPFWMRADQYGSIPYPNSSGSVIGGIHKYFDTANVPLFDWGGGLEVRANLGPRAHATIIEAYLKGAFSIFELRAGRYKSSMGLADSSLSTGSFAESGNALPIPRVTMSIPEYYTIPILGRVLAFKGSFGFGLIGKTPNQYGPEGPVHDTVTTYFHQASFYGRLGGDDWRLHLYGGFNHQVYFGDEKRVWGSSWNLSNIKEVLYVVTGKTWNYSKVGNHLGSIDLGLQYDFDGLSLFLYRQNFYDEGALFHLANLRDGLHGLRLTNTSEESGGFRWRKILFEYLCSTNQAGYPWSKYTPSGDEDYYNNYEYAEGWSYKGLALGNPLFTTRQDIRAGLPQDPKEYFSNNRILAFHGGIECSVNTLDITAKLTWSKNYGTFPTSIYGGSTGRDYYPPQYGIFPEVNELSAFLMVTKTFENGYKLGCAIAVDKGQLLYNSSGIILKLSKSFIGSYKKPSLYNE